jgi:peptide/nickel transport system substrate-binding protein
MQLDAANNSAPIGDLAKSWTISPDGLVYTFKLHEGVKFHDGSPLTSADVKASYERIANPPEGVLSIRRARYEDITSIETPDDTTVIFHLKAPNVSMLSNFASPFNCIYSAAKLKQNPRYPEKEVMGSGAFVFSEYVRGSHWTSKRFDGYFLKDRPYLDGFTGYFVKGGTVVSGMLGGQYDAEFRGLNPNERNQLLSGDKDRWTVHEGGFSIVTALFFNTTVKPFVDVRVRRALSLAIDRWGGATALSKISISKDVGGLLRPGYEFALPEDELVKLPGFSRDIEASRAQARKLLKEAGVENLKFALHTRPLPEPYVTAGIFIIDQWRRIGVTVESKPVEAAPYFDGLVSGKFEVAMHPPAEAADDPTAQLAAYMSILATPTSYSRHKDTRLDDLYEVQKRELDPAKRKAAIIEFQKLAISEAYTVPLHWWQRIIVHHKKIKGWHMSPSPFQGQSLVSVWIDE